MKKIAAVLGLLWAVNTNHASAVGRLADLTVVDRQQQRTLPVYWHQGRAYIEGRPGNEYQIVIHNRAGDDLLAVVSVDGVNVVTGETAAPSQGGYVIDRWQNLDITGWRKSLSATAAFYFTTLPDSYAARTGRPDNVGVIGAALFRRKAEVVSVAPPAPVYERYKRGAGGESEARRERADAAAPAASADNGVAGSPSERVAPQKSLGTGHGRGETSHARKVDFERATPVPEETIAIYYDSRANLLARGIIRETAWRPREPQPFPGGFVPDPPRW